MPTVTITLTDLPDGTVSAASDYTPAVGQRCSAAQAHALEIINRTRQDWGMTSKPRQFCEAVLNPSRLGLQATPELRDEARLALNLPASETWRKGL